MTVGVNVGDAVLVIVAVAVGVVAGVAGGALTPQAGRLTNGVMQMNRTSLDLMVFIFFSFVYLVINNLFFNHSSITAQG